MSRETAAEVRRIVRQKLESLQRAGLTHLPRSASTIPRSGLMLAGDSSADVSSASRAIPQQPPIPERKPGPQSLFAELEPSPAGKAPVRELERSTVSRDQRCAKLQELTEQVAACRLCQELAQTRTQTVFGVGNPEARIVFVGEAPGADEDKQGEPFVGRAGQLLNKIIEACGLKREEIYICNILKCRPPGNRNPSTDEAANCRGYLDGQLATIDPDYIVCWGTVAAQNLLDSAISIGKMRGKFYRYQRAQVLCTYHPSYLLRNPAAKKEVWNDMKFLMRDMGVDLD